MTSQRRTRTAKVLLDEVGDRYGNYIERALGGSIGVITAARLQAAAVLANQVLVGEVDKLDVELTLEIWRRQDRLKLRTFRTKLYDAVTQVIEEGKEGD